MRCLNRMKSMTSNIPNPNTAAHPPADKQIWFHGCTSVGIWAVQDMVRIKGEVLPSIPYADMSSQTSHSSAAWSLSGVGSNLRYTAVAERTTLQARQAALGRENAHYSVLIPIKKSASWWAMAQDERLAIYARSEHTNIGLDYLPAIARKLYHSRDLGEPFDFLTWFEFAAEDSTLFSSLLGRLRATEEWTYVERETEIWLTRV